MKRFLPLFLAICLLLGACGKNKDPEPTQTPTEAIVATNPTTQATETPTEPPTEPPTEAPTEPPVLYRNPLNGTPLDEPYTGRVFGATINNIRQALPHRGVSQADVYFEMFINDYMTRGLALFTNVAEVPDIGSVRSNRYNFTDIALAYDLVLAHGSGSKAVRQDMYDSGINHLDTNGYVGHRDKERYEDLGYAWEHTMFARGEMLVKGAKDKGYALSLPDRNYGMQFAENAVPVDGEDAKEIEIVFTQDGVKKRTIMKYDEQTQKYVYWQYDKEMIDENNGQPEAFANVLVLRADVRNQGVYHIADLYSGGDGYFATGGKLIPIKWIHEKETDPFTFTLEDGTPLYQAVGSSYIAIVPQASPVNYQ